MVDKNYVINYLKKKIDSANKKIERASRIKNYDMSQIDNIKNEISVYKVCISVIEERF